MNTNTFSAHPHNLDTFGQPQGVSPLAAAAGVSAAPTPIAPTPIAPTPAAPTPVAPAPVAPVSIAPVASVAPASLVAPAPASLVAPAPASPENLAEAAGYVEQDGAKHYPYTAEFTDEADEDRRFTFHFRRPQRLHVLTIAKAGKEKILDSQKEMLVQLALPAERRELREVLDSYVLLVTSFADEVFRKAGAGSVFAGK